MLAYHTRRYIFYFFGIYLAYMARIESHFNDFPRGKFMF